ncbi:hypothetical protein DAH89_14790, partial [Sphingomonas koreensis]
MRIRSVLLAATALAAALPAHAQHSRLDALERRLAEQQARIEQLEALVARIASDFAYDKCVIDAGPPLMLLTWHALLEISLAAPGWAAVRALFPGACRMPLTRDLVAA